jgi:AAA+ superfamily predicted ATPase
MKRADRLRNSLNTRVRDFLGTGNELHLVQREFPAYQVSNIQVLLPGFLQNELKVAKIVGSKLVRGKAIDEGYDISELLEAPSFDKDGGFFGVEDGPLWFKKPFPDDVDMRMGLSHALGFCVRGGRKMVIVGRSDERVFRRFTLGLITADVEAGKDVLSVFEEYIEANSVFRRRTLVPSISYANEVEEVRVLPEREVRWDELVLPEEMKEHLRVNLLEYIGLAPILRRNGFDTKRSVLFHGPPGTGKSLACAAICSSLKDFTKIILTGDDQTKAKAAFELARRFKPSLLIFEDIDMIGASREENGLRTVLSDLMNQLDGLQERDEIYVVFTTNYIEYLERALVDRPGRIDLVYGFPLPSEAARERLIRQYANRAHIHMMDLAGLVERTKGVTPAFIKELMRRAVLKAVTEGSLNQHGIARILDVHAFDALRDLQSALGTGTQRTVGYAS